MTNLKCSGRTSSGFDVATPIELNRLDDMIGPNADRFDKSGHTEAGPLFGIESDVLFAWADQSPDRAAFWSNSIRHFRMIPLIPLGTRIRVGQPIRYDKGIPQGVG